MPTAFRINIDSKWITILPLAGHWARCDIGWFYCTTQSHRLLFRIFYQIFLQQNKFNVAGSVRNYSMLSSTFCERSSTAPMAPTRQKQFTLNNYINAYCCNNERYDWVRRPVPQLISSMLPAISYRLPNSSHHHLEAYSRIWESACLVFLLHNSKKIGHRIAGATPCCADSLDSHPPNRITHLYGTVLPAATFLTAQQKIGYGNGRERESEMERWRGGGDRIVINQMDTTYVSLWALCVDVFPLTVIQYETVKSMIFWCRWTFSRSLTSPISQLSCNNKSKGKKNKSYAKSDGPAILPCHFFVHSLLYFLFNNKKNIYMY